MAEHFNTARNQGRIFGPFRTGTNNPHYFQAEFITALVSGGKHIRTVWITDDLHQTFTVAQVDKNHATVVTATMSPAVESHSLANEFFIHQARVNGSHKSSDKSVGN